MNQLINSSNKEFKRGKFINKKEGKPMKELTTTKSVTIK